MRPQRGQTCNIFNISPVSSTFRQDTFNTSPVSWPYVHETGEMLNVALVKNAYEPRGNVKYVKRLALFGPQFAPNIQHI